ELRAQGQSVRTIALSPLSRGDVDALLADTLRAPTESEAQRGATHDLAALVHERTEGNPFVLTRFLGHLADEKLLRFDPVAESWSWDLESVRRAALGEGAEDLLVRRMLALPASATTVLRVSACLGNTFDLGTLELVTGSSAEELVETLWPAVE